MFLRLDRSRPVGKRAEGGGSERDRHLPPTAVHPPQRKPAGAGHSRAGRRRSGNGSRAGPQRIRPRDRRRRSRWSRRCGLRRFGRAADGGDRSGGPGRPGRHHLDDRELPGLSERHQRKRAGDAGHLPGAPLRRRDPARAEPRGGRAGQPRLRGAPIGRDNGARPLGAVRGRSRLAPPRRAGHRGAAGRRRLLWGRPERGRRLHGLTCGRGRRWQLGRPGGRSLLQLCAAGDLTRAWARPPEIDVPVPHQPGLEPPQCRCADRLRGRRRGG